MKRVGPDQYCFGRPRESGAGPAAILPRRQVLRGLATAATAGLPRPGRASTRRTLRVGFTIGRNSQFGAGVAEFARVLEARSPGEWRIEDYLNAAPGGDPDLADAVKKGELDLAFFSSVVLANLVPEFGIFDLPFLFRDAGHARRVLDGPIGRAYLEKFREHDLAVLAWGENGVRHLTNSKRPIHAPSDLHGLRLRVPDSDVMLRCFRQLGADTASLAFPALYAALESGCFDGQDNPIATIRAIHLERVQHHLTLSAHIYSSAVFFISTDVWDDLSPSEQTIFREAARAGAAASREAADRAEREGIGLLRASGVKVVEHIDQAAFRAALEPTWSQLAERFGTGQIAQIQAQP